jgi:sodium-dependent dicarboxylate transporter 2/3/5
LADAAEIDWAQSCSSHRHHLRFIRDRLAETIGTSINDALGLSLVPYDLRSDPGHPRVGDDDNTASAAVVVPIVIPVAMAAGINPLCPPWRRRSRRVRLHAAGVDAAECDRLRSGSCDHHDD